MSNINFINFESTDTILTTPIDLHYVEKYAKETDIKADEYEFDESDSHVTDLVKDFCDSDFEDCVSDLGDVLHRLELSFDEEERKPTIKHSFNSNSTIASHPSPEKRPLKLSNFYLPFKSEEIVQFQLGLFQQLAFYEFCNFDSFGSEAYHKEVFSKNEDFPMGKSCGRCFQSEKNDQKIGRSEMKRRSASSKSQHEGRKKFAEISSAKKKSKFIVT